MSSDPKKKPDSDKELTRRTALARLGLGVALAYSAPTVLHIDRSANAALSATPCSRRGRKPRWCRRRDRDDDRGNGRGEGRGGGRDRGDDRRDRDNRGRGRSASRGNSRNNRNSRGRGRR